MGLDKWASGKAGKLARAQTGEVGDRIAFKTLTGTPVEGTIASKWAGGYGATGGYKAAGYGVKTDEGKEHHVPHERVDALRGESIANKPKPEGAFGKDTKLAMSKTSKAEKENTTHAHDMAAEVHDRARDAIEHGEAKGTQALADWHGAMHDYHAEKAKNPGAPIERPAGSPHDFNEDDHRRDRQGRFTR